MSWIHIYEEASNLAIQQCKSSDFESSIATMQECIDNVFDIIRGIEDENEQKTATKDVVAKTAEICEILFKSSVIEWKQTAKKAWEYEDRVRNKIFNENNKQRGLITIGISEIYSILADNIGNIIDDEATLLLETATKLVNDEPPLCIKSSIRKKIKEANIEIIGKYDKASYWKKKGLCSRCGGDLTFFGNKCKSCGNKEGCFVATACYGNYNATEVLVLRAYRDEMLLTNWLGTIFVKFYYLVSPPLAKQIEKSDKVKNLIKQYLLSPIVRKIKKRAESEKPNE